MVSGRRRPPREGPFALAAASQSINLAAHLSISSRRKKVSLHHASCFLRVADAAPTNGVFFELFLALDSLCYLFRKKFIVFAISLSRFLLLLHVSELLWRSFVVEVFQCYNSCRGGVNVDGYLQSTALPHLLFFSSPPSFFYKAQSARARRSPSSSSSPAAAYSCGGAAAASAAASSPSPAVSEVQSVRLSRSSCMIRVLSL